MIDVFFDRESRRRITVKVIQPPDQMKHTAHEKCATNKCATSEV